MNKSKYIGINNFYINISKFHQILNYNDICFINYFHLFIELKIVSLF